MIWPRSRTNTPKAARNHATPAVNNTCGTSRTGSHSAVAGTAPRTTRSPTQKSRIAKNSLTSPDTTRLTGKVSTANTSFFTKLRCSSMTVGARAAASLKASQGSIPARKYRAKPVRLGSAPNRERSTTPNTKK